MAASTKERKKEVDCVNLFNEELKNMRRGKPGIQLYTPGSGPLRKSFQGSEESEQEPSNMKQNQSKNIAADRLARIKQEDTSSSREDVDSAGLKLTDMSLNDRRRSKKPEQPLYIPRHRVPTRETEQQSVNRNEGHKNERNLNGNNNRSHDGPNERLNTHGNRDANRGKRFSNRRRNPDNPNIIDEEWRAPSPNNRSYRQGSEPRTSQTQSNNGNWSRIRDTRSVEPQVNSNRNYNSEKNHLKPPSGRRHSIGVDSKDQQRQKIPNLDNLPPRLRKKFLDENKINYPTHQQQQPQQQIPPITTEESWDGSSITFTPQPQQQQHTQQNYQQPKFNYMPNHHVNPQNNMVYYTLPNNRPRGRGRLQQDYDNPGMYRSMTPEKHFTHSPSNSRPATPTFSNHKTRSTDNLNNGTNMYRNDYEQRTHNNDRNHDQQQQQQHQRGRYNRNSEEKQSYGDRRDNQRNRGRQSPTPLIDQRDEIKTPIRQFRDSLEAQLSPVSPPSLIEEDVGTELADLVAINNDILDWSEEVEMHVRNLEEAAFSDAALTRSSSMASLMDSNNVSQLNTSNNSTKSKKGKKKRKNRRSGSSQRERERSTDNQPQNHEYNNGRNNNRNNNNNRDQQQQQQQSTNRQRQNSHCSSVDSSANFKHPHDVGPPPRTQQQRRQSREPSYDRKTRSRNPSRESSFERNRKSSCSEQDSNWRDEIVRSRNPTVEREVIIIKKNPERELNDLEVKKAGILILPKPTVRDASKPPVLNITQLPELHRKNSINPGQKTLFDPNNPNKPIIINKPTTRVSAPGFSENTEAPPPQLYTTDQFGNLRPTWYEDTSEHYKLSHYPKLLKDIKCADCSLQQITNSGCVLINWGNVSELRNFLMESLRYLICRDLKFALSENVEQHFWTILFYNIIDMTRKAIIQQPDYRAQYKAFLLTLIDEGTKFYDSLLISLEDSYNFNLGDFMGNNTHKKGPGMIGLALICAQKIYICMGDLGRYREQVNDSSNYGKCRQLYIKAHEINPKNAKPYSQLAVLAVLSRKKLDAVYFYMRSLMSSNPAPSTREALIGLFDENRKKYEHGERKRREERLEKTRLHMKEKESEYPKSKAGSLRKETWIRPNGGRRVHRTTSALPEHKCVDSDEEDLATLSSVEVNKRFVISYLHVHGKLITKIGMETFQETALQMLKEFRALLQHSPVPLPCTRFLQLLALNMFAIDSTQLKDPQLQSQTGYRSELQERALVVSIQMFSLILEKCVSLLQEHINNKPENINAIPQDATVLLPSVKVWCDWMLCHSSVWNPPPSTQDFRVGPAGDAWTRLASLMNLLERFDQTASTNFVPETKEGYDLVRLPEDGVLSGFTPLMYNQPEPTFVSMEFDMEAAQFALRLNKLLFFGTVFLCGLEPPVLKLEYQNDFSEYISVVCTTANRSSPSTPPELNESELLVESESGDEETPDMPRKLSENAPSEIQELLSRKVELEKRHRDQELHRQTVQKILQQSVVIVQLEIKPKNLVPDTNCFIDYLSMLKKIATSNVYTLMVPLVVLNELEGLAKGNKSPLSSPRNDVDALHVIKVAEASKQALEFLGSRHHSVKCITTKGTVLTSTTFTKEDGDTVMKNDDKILATCLTLCKGNAEQVVGEPRKLYREVVLLTEDRNLRVKAIARDVPVREVPSFLQWAGLG